MMIKHLLEWIEKAKSSAFQNSPTNILATASSTQTTQALNLQSKNGDETKQVDAPIGIAASTVVKTPRPPSPSPAPPTTTPIITPSPRVPPGNEKRTSEKESDDTEYDDDFDADDGNNGDDGRRARRKINS